ncbi:hypothetical protein BDZ89DRAFT_1049303 [Hymenopellis radicata]|nr:hypothetical protein BDZ89DRAFT_1049303 [Hymenopellis radicata]
MYHVNATDVRYDPAHEKKFQYSSLFIGPRREPIRQTPMGETSKNIESAESPANTSVLQPASRVCELEKNFREKKATNMGVIRRRQSRQSSGTKNNLRTGREITQTPERVSYEAPVVGSIIAAVIDTERSWKHCRKGWDLEDEWMGTALMAREQRREAVSDGQTSP